MLPDAELQRLYRRHAPRSWASNPTLRHRISGSTAPGADIDHFVVLQEALDARTIAHAEVVLEQAGWGEAVPGELRQFCADARRDARRRR